jgi:hypothetical protein
MDDVHAQWRGRRQRTGGVSTSRFEAFGRRSVRRARAGPSDRTKRRWQCRSSFGSRTKFAARRTAVDTFLVIPCIAASSIRFDRFERA